MNDGLVLWEIILRIPEVAMNLLSIERMACSVCPWLVLTEASKCPFKFQTLSWFWLLQVMMNRPSLATARPTSRSGNRYHIIHIYSSDQTLIRISLYNILYYAVVTSDQRWA